LDLHQEFLAAGNAASSSLHALYQNCRNIILFDKFLGPFDIIIFADHPLMLINIIFLNAIPERKHATVVAAAEDYHLPLAGEVSCASQSVQVSFSAGVGEADFVKAES
jgi:hypothetical protein